MTHTKFVLIYLVRDVYMTHTSVLVKRHVVPSTLHIRLQSSYSHTSFVTYIWHTPGGRWIGTFCPEYRTWVAACWCWSSWRATACLACSVVHEVYMSHELYTSQNMCIRVMNYEQLLVAEERQHLWHVLFFMCVNMSHERFKWVTDCVYTSNELRAAAC